MLRIFISSVQKELAGERRALKEYIHGDALFRRFFEVFLFEDLPASDRRADAVYLDEVARCEIYLGLFGNDYGFEDAEDISPTHREFIQATQLGIPRLILLKGANDAGKHPKMRALIRQAGNELIRFGPFDATACPGATLANLDPERMTWFLREARHARGFPLSETASTSTGSVQVMLFADRLEVWNPGSLPSALTLQKLREPHGSFPGNPNLKLPRKSPRKITFWKHIGYRLWLTLGHDELGGREAEQGGGSHRQELSVVGTTPCAEPDRAGVSRSRGADRWTASRSFE
jgi:hypothetical protein